MTPPIAGAIIITIGLVFLSYQVFKLCRTLEALRFDLWHQRPYLVDDDSSDEKATQP